MVKSAKYNNVKGERIHILQVLDLFTIHHSPFTCFKTLRRILSHASAMISPYLNKEASHGTIFHLLRGPVYLLWLPDVHRPAVRQDKKDVSHPFGKTTVRIRRKDDSGRMSQVVG